MSIRPIDFNGMVQRTQDMGGIKQNEDNKPMVNQQNIVGQLQKETEHHAHQVIHGDNAENRQKKFDAREKGSNEYQRMGKGKKKKEKSPEGKVVQKSYFGFDMKV